MDKLKMHSPDLTEQNIDKIAELFPTVVTERLDDDGNPVRAIDFDLLRQELSDHVVEGPQERYQLDWPGKRAALFAANAPIAKTLRPVREESVDFDTTQEPLHRGRQPRRTQAAPGVVPRQGQAHLHRPALQHRQRLRLRRRLRRDERRVPREVGPESTSRATRLVANTESNGRFHSDWLSMMYPRLEAGPQPASRRRRLIVVSIDDNEVDNLRRLCDEVFGAGNFVAQLVVQANEGGRDNLPLAQTHEYASDTLATTSPLASMTLATDGSSLPLEDSRGPYELRELRNRNP